MNQQTVSVNHLKTRGRVPRSVQGNGVFVPDSEDKSLMIIIRQV